MMRRRFLMNRLWTISTILALGIAIVPLIGILFDVVIRGIGVMSIDFFTLLPPAPCSNPTSCATGGLGNAIQGTLILVALSSAIGIPIGVISGIYVSEYGNKNLYGSTIRFLGDVLAGIPSVVTGVLGYLLIVVTMRGYSVLAGSIALGSMMIPIVSNTSTEALKAVPNSIREASHALGIRKWRTSLLVLAQAKKSVATAALLAIARITGETAPLLLTTGISSLWFSDLSHPIASLTFYIYYYATSAYPNWQALAWGAALILIMIVLGINAGVRILTRGQKVYS
jgi:phosphate transport system permease protein